MDKLKQAQYISMVNPSLLPVADDVNRDLLELAQQA